MLVDQVALPEDFHFQIDAVGKLEAIGVEFQPVISMGADMVDLAPDPAIAVRAAFEGQELTRITVNPTKIDPAGGYSRYFPPLPLPARRQVRRVRRYRKCRVGDEVGCFFRQGKMGKASNPDQEDEQG